MLLVVVVVLKNNGVRTLSRSRLYVGVSVVLVLKFHSASGETQWIFMTYTANVRVIKFTTFSRVDCATCNPDVLH